MTFRPSLAAFAAAGILAACGGGGGGSTDFDPVNAQAANAAFADLDGTWDMSGVGSDGASYRFVVSYQPIADGMFPFNGAASARRQVQGQGYVNGTLVSSGTSIDHFNPANSLAIGSESDGMCMVTTGAQQPPVSAEVGDSGGLFNYDVHASCTGGSDIVESGRYTWSVDAIDGKAYYCLNGSTTSLGVSVTSSECHEVAASGALGPDAAVIVVARTPGLPDFTLTAKTR